MTPDQSRPESPTPVAVIDIGSSAVRMEIAEIRPTGGIQSLDTVHKAVNLGRDAFTTGRLSEESIRSVCNVLRSFKHGLMEERGVQECRAVATSAVREAENRDTLLDRIFVATGLDVEVIEGSEENRLTYVAVREAMRGRPELKGRMLLVEVGGGNAALTLSHGERILHADTYQMGAIRLYAQTAGLGGGRRAETELLKGSVRNMVENIKRIVPIAKAEHFVAIGGDVRFAAGHILDRGRLPRVSVIDRKAFIRLCEEVEPCDPHTVVKRYRISYSQAETLVPALLAYRALLEATKAKQVCVPQATLRQGLLLDMAHWLTGRGGRGWQEQIITSAISLGEKFHFDRQHAECVRRLALALFDQLKALHRLEPRDRLLLEVAAILHDIGSFVSPRSHHKHTYYLVSSADLFGLRRGEVELVANVTRYHRRSCPKAEHAAYASLDREARVKVCKLAALLRVADALDRPHRCKVQKLKVRETDDEVSLVVSAIQDWTMERKALIDKADLFENTFGRRVTLLPT